MQTYLWCLLFSAMQNVTVAHAVGTSRQSPWQQ